MKLLFELGMRLSTPNLRNSIGIS
ncbi:hypothetical protein A2U01_0112199, partial [Trifolium medium]|nr:hypothetical protein [Trifolium medium]